MRVRVFLSHRDVRVALGEGVADNLVSRQVRFRQRRVILRLNLHVPILPETAAAVAPTHACMAGPNLTLSTYPGDKIANHLLLLKRC